MHRKIFAFAISLFLCNIPTIQAAQVLFTPALVLTEQFTDNLFLDYQNEEYDYITSTGIDLTGQILWRTAGIELSFQPSYNFYKENDYLDYWRYSGSLYMWKNLTRNAKLELRNTYLRTNDPGDQSPIIEQDGQLQGPAIEADKNRRGRNEYYSNVAQARIENQFGARNSVYAAYGYSILRNVDTMPGATEEDNDIATPSMGITYNISSKWDVEIDGSYAMTNYKEDNDRNEFNGNVRLLYRFGRAISGFVNYKHTILDFDQDTNEDYQIYEPSIGIRYDFKDNAQINIGAGYYIQDFETSENEEGFNITSNIFKRWDFRTSYFGISGSSGYIIDDNGIEDNGLNIYYQGGVETGFNFTSKFTGSVFVGYRYDLYPDESPERKEYTITTGATLNWQALQWMVIGLSYNFSDVTSDIETNEYTENTALLTIRMVPSTPFHLN